jgi:hypothetical protein
MFLRFSPRNEVSRSGEKNASLQVVKKQGPRCICLDQGTHKLHIQTDVKRVYPAPLDPHQCESCDIPLTNRLRVCAKKEILNVLSPHLAIFVLRFTPVILLNGLFRPEL